MGHLVRINHTNNGQLAKLTNYNIMQNTPSIVNAGAQDPCKK